ncbi:MAG: hypothetical protein NVS9B10_13860 [Nevskia sp.]
MLAELMGYVVDEPTRRRAIDEGGYFFDVDNQAYPVARLK